MPAPTSNTIAYLAGYPPSLVEPVRQLADAGRLGDVLRQRHPRVHDVRTDKALYDYVQAIRNDCLRNAPPLAKVIYDNRLQVVAQDGQRLGIILRQGHEGAPILIIEEQLHEIIRQHLNRRDHMIQTDGF